jgi:hypothetical protein
VAVGPGNTVYITGQSSPAGEGSGDILIAKYTSSGILEWQRSLGTLGLERVSHGAVDALGNIYVAGISAQFGGPTQGAEELLLAKYNSLGELQWQKILGGTTFELLNSIAIDSLGNVYVTGFTFSPSNFSYADLVLVKYDQFGNVLWQRLLGGKDPGAAGLSVAVDPRDDVYVAGRSGPYALIAKYDTNGNFVWQRTIDGGGNDIDIAYEIVFDFLNNIYVAGNLGRPTIEGSVDIFLAVLPNDGSLAGIYSVNGRDISYFEGNLISAEGSLVSGTGTAVNAESYLTSSSSFLVNSPASLVSHLTIL